MATLIKVKAAPAGSFRKVKKEKPCSCKYNQCCGAGGAEIILEPGAGAENKF